MGKTKRISVPVSAEIERQLRDFSAQHGCSVAASFSKIMQAGMQKSELQQELSEIRKLLKNGREGGRDDNSLLLEIRRELADFLEEIPRGNHRGGVLLPEKAAALLYQEALFSAALASEILNAELPGTTPKPAAIHIKNARQKSGAALQNFLAACRGEA